MAKKTTDDGFAIARSYVKTMHRFVEKHPARNTAELEMLANAALMFATQLAFPTGSKFTFSRQAQLCWDKYAHAKEHLEKIGAGAIIHPNGAARTDEPGYMPICKGDHLVLWLNTTTYCEVCVHGFTPKYVRVDTGKKFRMVKPGKLGLNPDLLETMEKLKVDIGNADACRSALDDFNKSAAELPE